MSTSGFDRDPPAGRGPDPALDALDALDVRTEMERSVADLPVRGDLLLAVHRRAHRIRRRRRVASGVAAALSAVAVVGISVVVPALISRRDTAPVVVARPSATPPATPVPSAPVPPVSPTGSAGPPPEGGAPSVWGAVTTDDDFDRPVLDRTRWSVYDGPADGLGRWSPAEVAVRDGALRLSVSRPGGDPPSSWGGIGAIGSGQRYGRWEVRMRMTVGRGVIGQFVLSPAPNTGAAAIVVSLAPYQRLISVSGTGAGAGGRRAATLRRPTEYHVVAVEWTPGHVRVLLDGARLFEWTDGRLPVPLWPALQTIMAGPDCGSVPVSADCQGTTTSFPQRFDVDRIQVRAYRG